MNDYHIDWDKPLRGWATSIVIGVVIPHPNIEFTVKRHHCRWDPETGRDKWEISFSVTYGIHGCHSEKVLRNRDEVILYLKYQLDLLPQYLDLIGKQEKIQERIRPLRRKLNKYSDQIFELAKQ